MEQNKGFIKNLEIKICINNMAKRNHFAFYKYLFA